MDRDEKTLILFKPDCVRKNLSGIILQRLWAKVSACAA
jgi:nucleoside diphosphate kinase